VLCSVLGQDYYKILEVDYDATDDDIRSNYIRLALVCCVVSVFLLLGFRLGLMWVWLCAQKWHPDKQKDQDSTTSRFQDINEAYQGMYISMYLFLGLGIRMPSLFVALEILS